MDARGTHCAEFHKLDTGLSIVICLKKTAGDSMKQKNGTVQERLLAAAVEEFTLLGFDGATTRSIVARAGSSLSALQECFGSKQNLYTQVLDQAMTRFYQPCIGILSEISQLEQHGLLQGDRAWDMIVVMTERVVEWAFSPENRYINLLIHREMLFPSRMPDDAMCQIQALYLHYAALFEAFTQTQNTPWAKYLAFRTVTGFFDAANCPQFLGQLMNMDLTIPENQTLVKAQVIKSTLTTLRAILMQHRNPSLSAE